MIKPFDSLSTHSTRPQFQTGKVSIVRTCVKDDLNVTEAWDSARIVENESCVTQETRNDKNVNST